MIQLECRGSGQWQYLLLAKRFCCKAGGKNLDWLGWILSWWWFKYKYKYRKRQIHKYKRCCKSDDNHSEYHDAYASWLPTGEMDKVLHQHKCAKHKYKEANTNTNTNTSKYKYKGTAPTQVRQTQIQRSKHKHKHKYKQIQIQRYCTNTSAPNTNTNTSKLNSNIKAHHVQIQPHLILYKNTPKGIRWKYRGIEQNINIYI